MSDDDTIASLEDRIADLEEKVAFLEAGPSARARLAERTRAGELYRRATIPTLLDDPAERERRFAIADASTLREIVDGVDKSRLIEILLTFGDTALVDRVLARCPPIVRARFAVERAWAVAPRPYCRVRLAKPETWTRDNPIKLDDEDAADLIAAGARVDKSPLSGKMLYQPIEWASGFEIYCLPVARLDAIKQVDSALRAAIESGRVSVEVLDENTSKSIWAEMVKPAVAPVELAPTKTPADAMKEIETWHADRAAAEARSKRREARSKLPSEAAWTEALNKLEPIGAHR